MLPWHDTISGAGCDVFFYLLFHSFLYLPFHLFIFAVSFSIISVSILSYLLFFFIFAEPSSDMLLLPWHDTISDAGYAEIIVVANMVENFDIYEVEIFAKCQL